MKKLRLVILDVSNVLFPDPQRHHIGEDFLQEEPSVPLLDAYSPLLIPCNISAIIIETIIITFILFDNDRFRRRDYVVDGHDIQTVLSAKSSLDFFTIGIQEVTATHGNSIKKNPASMLSHRFNIYMTKDTSPKELSRI